MHHYPHDQIIAPDLRNSQGPFWTVSALQIVVKAWYAVEYRTTGSYRRLLYECDLSYQQTEHVYRSRPNAQMVPDCGAELEKK